MSGSKFAIDGSASDIKARIGVAKLTKLAFDGADLGSVWNDLVQAIQKDPGNAAIVMDLSVVAQLVGDAQNGAKLQDGALAVQRLYRSPTAAGAPSLRLLALAGATNIGGNIPLEFLLNGSDVELTTLYIVPGRPLPDPLPDHDLALVALGYSDDMIATLEDMEDIAAGWPRPLLNQPAQIFELERDRFFALMRSVARVEIPQVVRVSRAALEQLASGGRELKTLLSDAEFPIIARPVDSHAGHGLMKLDDAGAVRAYLAQQAQSEFFISCFVDYSSPDGLYRKYRIIFIDGRAYACHMAIAEEWKVWYLNAQMGQSPEKRAEEARFMQSFDDDFALRHAAAFEDIVKRVGLDYFGIDCAETKDGQLLIFEGETAMIVHDMDPPDVYPYKIPQMRKLFAAFVAMLHRRAKSGQAQAA